MVQALACPACSASKLNVLDCDSMMALNGSVALFSLRCPTCGTRISSIQPIPIELRGELRNAALKTEAMGFLNA